MFPHYLHWQPHFARTLFQNVSDGYQYRNWGIKRTCYNFKALLFKAFRLNLIYRSVVRSPSTPFGDMQHVFRGLLRWRPACLLTLNYSPVMGFETSQGAVTGQQRELSINVWAGSPATLNMLITRTVPSWLPPAPDQELSPCLAYQATSSPWDR